MKVLLIYPQYNHHNRLDPRMPSVSLLYLAATLERYGHKVEIYDASLGPITKSGQAFRYGVSHEEVYRFLRSHSFDIVGITCSFAARWPFVSKIAKQVKELYSSIPVVIGGLFPTYNWRYCLDNCRAVELVMLGEAELTFAEVLNKIARGENIDDSCRDVDGVVWRVADKIFWNPKREYNDKLDELSFPAWHLLALEQILGRQRNFYELRPPYFTVLSSRGCPEPCSFCNMYITHGCKWRGRSAKNFVDELEFLSKRYKVKNFFIADDNFSFNLGRAKNICREILNRRLHIHYNTGNGLSIKRIDKELLELMKASGCSSIALAIESGSEKIRNQVYKKGISTDKIFQAVKWCDEVGLPCIGFFMVGAPGENRKTVEETKRLLKRLPLTICTCSIYTPYPGTELYDECMQKGYLKEVSPEDENRVEFATSMLVTPDFRAEDVKKWQKGIYLHLIRHKWPRLLKQLINPKGIISFSDIHIIKNFL